MQVSFKRLGRIMVCALPFILADAATAQRLDVKPAHNIRSAPAEATLNGVSAEQILAEQQVLHEWLVTQVPARGSMTTVSVGLTERDVKDLETPHIGGSATPMRVGVVKAIGEKISFSRAKTAVRSVRGQKVSKGTFQTTADGGFVWAIGVTSPGAVALRVHFENFSLPANTEAFFFSRDGEAHGPYVGTGVDGSGEFWSHSIASSTGIVMIRQFGPAADANVRGPSLSITEVAHIAIDFPSPQAGEGSVASFCTYNAVCVENDACTSDPAVADARGAVAKMRWISGAFVNLCSGGLIADTDGSTQIPYFMTANHCISKGKDAKNLETFFLYTASCGTTNCPSSFGQPFSPPSTLGAVVRATGSTADFTLLELKQGPPAGTTFLGWSTADVANSSGAALHRVSHPSGAPQAYSQHSVDTAIGTCLSTARGPWIYSSDVVGATEGGSSGSPVVNAAGEFVGQLTGCCPVGGGDCGDVCNANNHTIDGAFAFYFSSVESFLDPQGGGGGCTLDSECDDGDPCNGAETCASGSCQSGSAPACQNGDGCCPSGCTSSNDDDCMACAPIGSSCVDAADCCSNKCKGRAGNKTCK